MTETWQRDPRSVAEHLIERGSAYDTAAMEATYDRDQSILFVEDDGSVRRAGRDETLALFRGWAEAGAEPLSTEAEFLHVETGDDHAVALIRRRMKADEPSRLYELRLRKVGEAWKVSGETVSPWPPEMAAPDLRERDGTDRTRAILETYLRLLGENAAPEAIAALFSDDVDFDIPGDTASVPWIGRREGRAGVTAFFAELRAMSRPEGFEVVKRMVDGDTAIVLGSLKTRVLATDRLIDSAFAIAMTIRNEKIVRYRLLEDSFAASEAVRPLPEKRRES